MDLTDPGDEKLDDEWFSKKPTWRPPPRKASSRPPKNAPATPSFEEDDVDRWFL